VVIRFPLKKQVFMENRKVMPILIFWKIHL